MAVDVKTMTSLAITDLPTYDGQGHVDAKTLPSLTLEEVPAFSYASDFGGGEVVRVYPRLVRNVP